MIIQSNFFLVIFLLQGVNLLRFPGQEKRQDCEEIILSEEEKVAYLGWPHKIKCSLLNNDYDVYDWVDEDSHLLLSCLITISDRSDVVLFNETTSVEYVEEYDDGLLLSEVLPNKTYSYYMELQAPNLEKCLFTYFDLIPTTIQHSSCDTLDVKTRKVEPDKPFIVYCDVGDLYPQIYDAGLEYQIERNCSEVITKDRQYRISSSSFGDSGIYTCSFTYKGMKQYLQSYRLEICSYINLSPNISLSCSSIVLKRTVGEVAAFECYGVIGTGFPSPLHFFYWWRKVQAVGNFSEQNKTRCGELSRSSEEEHYSCGYTLKKTPAMCMNGAAIVPLHFKINDINEEDFGTYTLELQTSLGVNGRLPTLSIPITLEKNLVPNLLSKGAILAISVAVFVFFIFLMLLTAWHMLYIRVYLKRHFGEYTSDDKKYGASLFYNYSQEFDSFSQNDLRLSIDITRNRLEGMGYRIYDENKNGFDKQGRVENIQFAIEKSHRIIIFLTFKFIKDEWSLLTLQQGFNKMINSGSNIIFILLPGIQEYLKQHQHDDVVCCMIKRAIQLNYAITWTSKLNFNAMKFSFHLEDAMPKLKSQKLFRSVSTSSESDSSLENYKDITFQRCFSNETDITVLDLKKSNGKIMKIMEEQTPSSFDSCA